MIRQDGAFHLTNKMNTLFPLMGSDKQLRMDKYSVLIDCVRMREAKWMRMLLLWNRSHVAGFLGDVYDTIVCTSIDELIMYLDMMKDRG